MRRVKHSAKLSEIEIDMRLEKSISAIIRLCNVPTFKASRGMVRSTAVVDIRRLRQEGKPQRYRHSQSTYLCAGPRILWKVQRLSACQIN